MEKEQLEHAEFEDFFFLSLQTQGKKKIDCKMNKKWLHLEVTECIGLVKAGSAIALLYCNNSKISK